MEKSLEINPEDARVLFELQQLYKNTGISVKERLALFHKYIKLTKERDDCFLEMAVLQTQIGEYAIAEEMLKSRKFNIYEGGEGKLTKLHGWLHVLIGREYLQNGDVSRALEEFRKAFEYPENYGEGKSYMAQEAHIEYYTGLAYEKSGESKNARENFEKASRRNDQISEVSYFEGMAFSKLGKKSEADAVFLRMVTYGESIIANAKQYGYYGVGMPVPQMFEGDIERTNTINGALLTWLGYKGSGKSTEAGKALGLLKQIDPYNFKMDIMQKAIKDITII